MERLDTFEIVVALTQQFWPVWLALLVVMGVSYVLRAQLGLYGQVYDTGVGFVGLLFVLFWLFTAIFADQVATVGPIDQYAPLKRKLPGSIDPNTGVAFLLGGDGLGRDVFSRMVHGSRIVLAIAPAATVFAFMVGITLGLPAGYYGGKIDAVLSFLANLVLAFPVILLFYLLVTPEIQQTLIPQSFAGIFFVVPIVFFAVLFGSRFREQPVKLAILWTITAFVGAWIYSGLVFDRDPLALISLDPNELNIFVAVVFASAPGVFRIVRGLVMDVKTRDYVAAAQTRGEGPWYIMLWEVLPNARGPLIVDACLRIGYTTILLGTLGFFGLGLAPESPDWGTTIKDGSRLLRAYPHPAVPPALALMSFVLGLNLLADALREQSLKD